MHPVQYVHMISHAKSLVLKTLPKVIVNFRDLCMPWVPTLTQPLVRLSQESCLRNGDLDTYFELLTLCEKLLRSYSVGALPTVTAMAFQDTELSVSSLVSLLMRLILRKSDTSEVNLRDRKAGGNIHASRAFSNQVQRQKQRQGQDLKQEHVSLFLSE